MLRWEDIKYNPLTGIFTHATTGKQLGGKKADGSISLKIENKNYRAHRVAWFLSYNEWPEKELHFKNGIRSDIRLENLYPTDWVRDRKNIKYNIDSEFR